MGYIKALTLCASASVREINSYPDSLVGVVTVQLYRWNAIALVRLFLYSKGGVTCVALVEKAVYDIHMQTQKHYSRAPITEALIDIQAQLPQGIKLDVLAQVYSSIQTKYPKREEVLMVQGQMIVGESVGATASQSQIGYVFFSNDQKQILQMRLDGFTFSRLAPYDSWEAFRDEAFRLWSIYQSLAHPQAITRLSIRYINRLDIPLPVGDLKEYLRTFPEVSSDYKKVSQVLVCTINLISEFEEANPAFAKKGRWNDVLKGKVEGLHLLASPTNPDNNRDALVVNFREMYTLPYKYLLKHATELGSRWRLKSPYLEHFSQVFARLFMRVGLPSSIPPYS